MSELESRLAAAETLAGHPSWDAEIHGLLQRAEAALSRSTQGVGETSQRLEEIGLALDELLRLSYLFERRRASR